MNMKLSNMNCWNTKLKMAVIGALYFFMLGYSTQAVSQSTPVVTVRFANPTYNCATGQYCADVEFRADTLGVQIFGMNVRFFYADTILELANPAFSDFQGGYGPVSPDPPIVITSGPAGPGLFNFVGPADFVNGAIQLVNPMAPAIFLDTLNWTKLFTICFDIDDPNPNIQSFCPSLVWDLEQDPANGGFLIGDDGVVITLVDPTLMMESIPADENVVQFNWVYSGQGTPPFGMPVQDICISLDCSPMIVCAVDTTIRCDASTDPTSTGIPTATDICDGDPTFTFTDSIATGNCPNNYSIVRTWIAANDCMLFDTCVQLISVIDTTAPIIACPNNVTLECASQVPPANPNSVVATDNCPGAVTVTFIGDVTSNQTCVNRFTIARTYKATDGCGNSATCTQTITVFDNIAPSITCPTNVTVQCASLVPVNNPASVVSTDNCGGLATVTFVNDVISNQLCVNRFNITRTYRATDECGNSATCAQTITVFDNTPPTLTCPAPITVQCTSQVPAPSTASVTSSDNCNGAATITFVNDVITNQICVNHFNVNRTYRATDECGNSATCTQVITVFDNTAPSLTCPPAITVQCASLVPAPNTASVTATDNCNGASSISFVNDVITNQTCVNRFNVNRTYRATDECGNSATCTQIITVFDNTPPSLTCPPAITVQCASQVPQPNTASVTATDNCNGASSITFVNDVITNQTCINRFNVNRTYRATDECGNSATCTQIITVFDNVAPFVACPANITVQCAADVPVNNPASVSASDNCGGSSTVTFVGDVITNQTCANRFLVNRTYQATDACGNTETCTQIITVFDNTPPSITCPANITVQCASLIPANNPASVVSSDNCAGGSTVTFVGDVVSNQTCVNRFTLTRTYQAIDVCGNTATCAQTITVFDNSTPSITCPANITVQCAADVPANNPGSVITSDNCAGGATVTFVGDVVSSQTCTNRFTLTRTYQSTDACGNSATCAQTITVFDNSTPSITCPANITVQCAADVPANNPGSVITSDNCAGGATVTFIGDVISNQTCTNRFTLTRTYQSTDACGNSATCAQTITVFDNTTPSITCPANVTVQCASLVPANNPGSVISSDNCGGGATVTFVSDVISNQTCANRFTLTRTYRSTDACGNSASCSQIITVNDITPPTITCPANVTINFGASTLPANTGNPTGSDNCTGTPTFSFADVVIPGGCAEQFAVARTWTATDACGLTSTCVQAIGVNGNCQVDLALVKLLDAGQGIVQGGDNVNFTITVTNQGLVSVSSVTITDYIPLGFTLNDPDWTPGTAGSTGQSASIILSIGNGGLDMNGLSPGESASVQITLQADANILPGQYFNTAEISLVLNLAGIAVGDVDSTPDQDNTNDPAGEDDISMAAICVLPQPVIQGDAYACPGETLVYTVENYNPNFTYTWNLNGGGNIIANTGGTITIQWLDTPGGPFEIHLTVTIFQGCQADAYLNVVIQGIEGLACNDNVQVSLDGDCQVVITPSMILSGQLYGENYIVIIYDQDGNIIPNATLTWENIGQTYIVKIQSECNVQSCWGTVSVEDKIPPQIACVCPVDSNNSDNPACQITCLQVDQLVNGIIPPGLQPEVTDNCGHVTVGILNTNVNYDNCAGGFVDVTWKATDLGGNMATCTQRFTVIPLTLDSLVFPPNYIGVCGSSVNPAITGWPQLDGVNLTDAGGVCNIFAGYWDKELTACGGGRKIVRTWTVLDWCTVQIVEQTQIIKLVDDQGPTLTCPSDITVGTEFWYCYANVSVPKPVAYDNCSDITTLSLASSGGTVVQYGNNFVINGLVLGTYLVTWTVGDECGNTSTCSFHITVIDDVAPVANCDAHTVVSLTNDGPSGITLVPASVFDDGSYDNCGPVTFRARRMDSCIDFDWTTEGACIDDIPGGVPPVNSRDRGTVHRPCVPFACCDVGAGPIMVELEVTDASGNVNYCMIEAIVQDKIAPFVQCPPDITVSCDYWFNVQEGTFVDADGNNNGNLDEDPLTPIFGNMYDAFRYPESARKDIIIKDPGNTDLHQPHNWGIDGWANDNCEVNLQVRVHVINDCSGDDLPPGAPAGAVKLIERRFSASDGNPGIAPGTCTQRIWVVNFDPFYITDQTCHNENPNDGVIWPCDVLFTNCPDSLTGTGEPTIINNACSLIGVAYEDQRFDFVDGACFKILREWSIIDWCQYNSQTGEGLWHYTQVIKVHDTDGPQFLNCPAGPVTLCVADDGVSLPDNNQAFLGEENPLSSSCSVHLNLCQKVHEGCSDNVNYDVKLYLNNGDEFIYLSPLTTVPVDENHDADLCFNTRNNPTPSIRQNGIPYNSPFCGDYHKILWSAEDGCGNWSHCEYLIRLEDCKQPSPVCINGLSTVVMPVGGQVTIWAKDFDASSFDDCTPSNQLLFSFSGDSYQPSYTYTCDNVPAFGTELTVNIWVADNGTDDNCNGVISWDERNKDYCTTTIVITDNANVCDTTGSILAGEILTDHSAAVSQVKLTLTNPGHLFPSLITSNDGKFKFGHLLPGQDYTITPERDDNCRNGVSTLDLVRIQKHLLGKELFTSPYQYIAADANNSSSVSAIDLIEIRKLILGIYNTFPSSKSWTFVDKNFVMSDPTHPWPYKGPVSVSQLQGNMNNVDFVGVKVGDVNNSVQANAQDVHPRDGRRILNISATAPDKVEAGDMISMKLTIPEELSGFQWTLETEGLEYAGVSSDDIEIGDENIGLLENGIVTMSWNGDILHQSNANHDFTVVMRWKATAPGKVSKMVRLTSFVTPAEGYTPADEILDVKLRYSSEHGQTEFGLYQNRPNPWNGQTTIGFDLPKDDHATLTIFDVTGKIVSTIEGDFKTGYNTIVLTGKDIPSTGVMYYRLESGGYSASKKMVILR